MHALASINRNSYHFLFHHRKQASFRYWLLFSRKDYCCTWLSFGFYTTNLANQMTTDFGGFWWFFEECINFGTAFIWGVVGKGKDEVGGSKLKEESETIQVLEFRVVMKSISSCVVISTYSFCYSWPVSPTRLNYTYVTVMTLTAISGLHH